MFDLFRRKSKMKVVESSIEIRNNLSPPSYQSSASGPFTDEKKLFDSTLETGCHCHLRHDALKSSVLSLHARYMAVPSADQICNPYTWTLSRVKSLLGCVHAAVTNCEAECQCHDEYAVIKAKVEQINNATKFTKVQIDGMSNKQYQAYELYFGEMMYLHSMLRECVVKS